MKKKGTTREGKPTRKSRGRLVREPSREETTRRHLASLTHEGQGPARLADPHAIGPADVKSVSAIPGSREPGKTRGAQPGNHNAIKHGFYSHLFREHERRILDEQPLTDLGAEIELLHVTTARFLEAMAAADRSQDYESNIMALRLVNLSAQSIATLIRVQALTGALSRDLENDLKEMDARSAEDAAAALGQP